MKEAEDNSKTPTLAGIVEHIVVEFYLCKHTTNDDREMLLRLHEEYLSANGFLNKDILIAPGTVVSKNLD